MGGEWIPGVSGLAPDEQGTEDGVIGSSGVVPDDWQQGLQDTGANRVSPVAFLLSDIDPEGTSGGRADNLAEGLYSPSEQYDPEGALARAHAIAFDGGNFDPDGDEVDLPGPSVNEAAEGAGDALTDPNNPVFKVVEWVLNNPAKSAVAAGALYILPALSRFVGVFADA